MANHTHTFPREILSGKRIAIIGPADSAYGRGEGKFIDNFDIVVRLNKAPFLIEKGTAIQDIGSKTDILFHSFFENEFSGGGPLNFDLYRSIGISYVVNPIPTYFGLRVIFNFYKKYKISESVFVLSQREYRKIEKPFGGNRPTTGFCCLQAIMQSDFSELYISGFTFFKTPYGDGYRDQIAALDKVKEHIKNSTKHNPDIEFTLFKQLLRAHSKKMIKLDPVLEAIIHNDN